ncbi:hypothetical protein ABO04_11020 [Nitrosomonas sp. HPC101]|nr:hypothetical protein [Nitrosomonas sp. HPC101]
MILSELSGFCYCANKKYLTKRAKVTSLSDVSGGGIEAFLEQNEKYGVKNQAETAISTWLFAMDSNENIWFSLLVLTMWCIGGSRDGNYVRN